MSGSDTPEKVGVILIHGVGECEPGWINQYVVDRLQAHAAKTTPDGPSLQTEPFSRAYHLDDRGRTKPGSTS